MHSMDKSMKRLAGTQTDTATPPKRSKTSSTAPEINNSDDPDSEKSDSEELNVRAANGDMPSAGSADKHDELLNEIAQDFESDEKKLTLRSLKNWQILSISDRPPSWRKLN